MKEKTDISNHSLVAKHFKLSEKDKRELFDKYGVTFKEIPKILANDPALASLDVKTGDMLKIVRKSQTSGETIFYRSVTE